MHQVVTAHTDLSCLAHAGSLAPMQAPGEVRRHQVQLWCVCGAQASAGVRLVGHTRSESVLLRLELALCRFTALDVFTA
jgi:hypothetical protein